MEKTKSSKELYWGVTLSYMTTFVSLGVSLLLTPIIIRLLGQSDYGLYESIGSFVNYLAVLDLGFGAVVTRYTAKYQQEGDFEARDKFLYTCRNIYLVLCGIILALGACLYVFLDDAFGKSFTPEELSRAKLLYVIVLFTTAISIFSQVYKGLLNGVQLFIWPRIIQLIKAVLSKVVSIVILYWGANSVGFTAVILVFEIVSCILLMYKAHQTVTFVRNRMPKKQLFEILTFTSYLFVLAIVGQIYWQIDKLVLGMILGTISVAIYSAALNIENILRNVSSSIKDVLIPKAAQITEEQIKTTTLTTDFMIKSGRIILMVYGLMVIGITVLGEKFIYLWLGEDYVSATPLLWILGYSTLLPTVLLPGEELCKTFNRHGPLTLIYLLVSILNIVLTVVMVKSMGLYGAAYSTAIGLIVGNVIVSLAYFKKVLNINVTKLLFSTFHGITIILIIVGVIGYGVDKYIMSSYSWFNLCIEGVIMVFSFFMLMHFFGFNNFEKQIEYRIVNPIVNKFKRL